MPGTSPGWSSGTACRGPELQAGLRGSGGRADLDVVNLSNKFSPEKCSLLERAEPFSFRRREQASSQKRFHPLLPHGAETASVGLPPSGCCGASG